MGATGKEKKKQGEGGAKQGESEEREAKGGELRKSPKVENVVRSERENGSMGEKWGESEVEEGNWGEKDRADVQRGAAQRSKLAPRGKLANAPAGKIAEG